MLGSKDMYMQRSISEPNRSWNIRSLSDPGATSEIQSVKTRLLPSLEFVRPYLGVAKLRKSRCQSLFVHVAHVASYLQFWLPVMLYFKPSTKALI